MILFIGTQAAGYFVSEVAAECGESVTYTGKLPALKQVSDIALESLYDFIILHVDELPGSHEEIAEMLSRVQKVTKSTLVVLAMNYSLQSELVQNIQKMGLSHVIVDVNLSEIKRQLGQIFRLEWEQSAPPIPTDIPENSSPCAADRTFQTVAIAGANPHMGATTLALQFVKYLLFCGQKACYIQMNASGYISALRQGYEVQSEDVSLGRVTYQNVDLYEKQDKISHVRKLDYDFYIYDYGVCTAPDFQRVSFLEKDRKFLVCGTSPEELCKTNDALSEFYDTDLQYIFNLVPEHEQPDILTMMEEKAAQTYFTGYIPDPFVYSSISNSMYGKIFGEGLKAHKEARKKEKSRWRKGRLRG